MFRLKKNTRKFMNKYPLLKKIYLFLSDKYIILLSKMDDTRFAKYKYRQNTGKKLNLDNPVTFNDKLWWLKLNNRDPLLTVCTDKILVRDYVSKKGFEHILTNIYGIYDNANDIDFDSIPESSYIKTNHACGTNMIYKMENFNKKKFVKIYNKYLSRNYYYQSREWNYKNIVPKIYIEENLNPHRTNLLVDYRFLCFNGVVKYVFADIETAAEDGSHYYGAKRNVYNKDFVLLNIKAHRENFDYKLVNKPNNWNEMIRCAEILSSHFVFCRVDLYNIDGIIKFGEMTFYPGGATQSFYPTEIEYELGDLIDLTSDKIIKGGYL